MNTLQIMLIEKVVVWSKNGDMYRKILELVEVYTSKNMTGEEKQKEVHYSISAWFYTATPWVIALLIELAVGSLKSRSKK